MLGSVYRLDNLKSEDLRSLTYLVSKQQNWGLNPDSLTIEQVILNDYTKCSLSNFRLLLKDFMRHFI